MATHATPNPLKREGRRNLFCPYYRKCLDRAVNHHWPFWSCSECVHRGESELLYDSVLTCSDAYPLYTLPRRPPRLEG